MYNFQERITCLLPNTFCAIFAALGIKQFATLVILTKTPTFLWGWVDADWAGDTDTRRSHTGYILMMNGKPISWKSRRQDNVSLSQATSEAQFVAASPAGQEAIYLRETLPDFFFFLKLKPLFCTKTTSLVL